MSSLVRAMGADQITVPQAAALRSPSRGAGAREPRAAKVSELDIFHFNDVYHISEREAEPVGGSARFAQAMRNEAKTCKEKPLIMFSGDVFAPSLTSTITKGTHMVPVLNSFGIDVSMPGNHDFDFGIEHLASLIQDTNFPWVLSNCNDKHTDEPLSDCLPYQVLVHATGVRVGVIGVIENEWLETLATVDIEDVVFERFSRSARRLGHMLKDDLNCSMVVALSHMRWPNDWKLAEEAGDVISLVLGGHDHFYRCEKEPKTGCYVLKSGTDFREFSHIKLFVESGDEEDSVSISSITRCEVTRAVPPADDVAEIVEKYEGLVGAELERPLCITDCVLDVTVETVRTKESNIGDFICDIMRHHYDADVALLNSGTLRSSDTYGPGVFRLRDLLNILPMDDPICKVLVTGSQLKAVLENGVSQYPKHEGRFPQVSGIWFGFDPRKPPGSRIEWVEIGAGRADREPLQLDREYMLVTKGYLLSGKDGYDAFTKARVCIGPEEGTALQIMVENHLKVLAALDSRCHGGVHGIKSIYRKSVRQLQRESSRNSSFHSCDGLDGAISRLSLDGTEDCADIVNDSCSSSACSSPPSERSIDERAADGELLPHIRPEVEGRIVNTAELETVFES